MRRRNAFIVMGKSAAAPLAALSLLILPVVAAEQKKAPDTSHYQQLYSAGNYTDALAEARKILAAVQKQSGKSGMDYAYALNRVANDYYAMKQYADAEPLYRQAIEAV